jgi:hypothetical protein
LSLRTHKDAADGRQGGSGEDSTSMGGALNLKSTFSFTRFERPHNGKEKFHEARATAAPVLPGQLA